MTTRRQCANAIRALAIDAIEKSSSGHPGAPLGMADMAEALWRHCIKHNPANPGWVDRDRFVLSNGHASMLLYAVLHLSGYEFPMDEIRNFRQWESKTPGHPERGLPAGVEMTTGPLGQGISSAVGMALAERMLANQFNRPGHTIVDHYTYAFCGDGCLMEGVSHEACSLAGTWKLGKLVILYDSNGISIDGSIDPWFSEDVGKRYESYGWQVLGPLDGHDSDAIDKALADAKAEKDKPSLIICRTHIGFGSPKEDSASSHGAPLGESACDATRRTLGWHEPPFTIPEDIYAAWDARPAGKIREDEWNKTFIAYKNAYPELAAEFLRRMSGDLPADFEKVCHEMIAEAIDNNKAVATRIASKNCLEHLVPNLPEMVGGSADLSGSVGTQPSSAKLVCPGMVTGENDSVSYSGNYISYGVREFGMGAIMNGLALHGGFIPYAGTFMAFADQAKNAMRLSAIMGLRVIWVLTHDSIGVGEDGPTHQPIEQLPMLRLMPNMNIWRPCDMVETAVAWKSALLAKDVPTCLSLSRQSLQIVKRDNPNDISPICRGGYVLSDCSGTPQIILMATGSEIFLVTKAAEQLATDGVQVRVVSMPCAEVFDAQDDDWKNSVLPTSVRCRLAVEASSSDWWYKYTGLDGDIVGLDRYGVSAPGNVLFERLGFTVANVVARAKALLAK